MQRMNNKKIWFFLVLGIMFFATVCIWQVGDGEKKAYANGRIVQRQEQGKTVCLTFDSCDPVAKGESRIKA